MFGYFFEARMQDEAFRSISAQKNSQDNASNFKQALPAVSLTALQLAVTQAEQS